MIETPEDYNERLGQCGCCGIPVCPTPIKINESISSFGYGVNNKGPTGGNEGPYYLTYTTTYVDGGSRSSTYDRKFDYVLGGMGYNAANNVANDTPPYTGGSNPTTYSGEFTVATARAEYLAEMESIRDWDNPAHVYNYGHSKLQKWDPPGAFMQLGESVWYRFRFRIPDNHPGSYFKITYDIAEWPYSTPPAGGSPVVGDPSFVSQDNVVEWTGPGDPEDPEGESWLTPWVEVDPPGDSGRRRVVNVRYECRHGVKIPSFPQTTGETLVIEA